MRRVAAVALLAAATAAVSPPQDRAIEQALRAISGRTIHEDVIWLAAAERRGRESGGAESHETALYIARIFGEAGLEPGGLEGTWFQSFDAEGVPHRALRRAPAAESNFLEIQSRGGRRVRIAMGENFRPWAGCPDGDVEGTLAVLGDRAAPPRGGIAVVRGAEGAAERVRQLAQAGAAAVLVAVESPPPLDGSSMPVPVAWVTMPVLERLAEAVGRPVERAEGLRIRGARLCIRARGPPAVGFKNVIGVHRAAEEPQGVEYVVIGAHYDHLGMGMWGSRGTPGRPHLGANDNASGTAAILAVARALRQLELRRSVVVVAFDAEERGLWGSRAFVEAPPIPLERCVAMINLDMVGRQPEAPLAMGRTDPAHEVLNQAIATAQDRFRCRFDLDGANEYLQRGDQWSFARRGVPALFLFGGMHDGYHTEHDTVDRLHLPKIEAAARVTLFLAYELAR